MYNDNQMDTINDLSVFRTKNDFEISDGFNGKVIKCNDQCVHTMCFQEHSELMEKHISKDESNDKSYDNTFNLFSGHTRSTGRSNIDHGTTLNANKNLPFQGKSMFLALGPEANYIGGGLNYIQTNTGNNTQTLCDDCVFENVEPRNHVVQCKSGNLDANHSMNCVSGKHYMVHFTN